MRNKKFLVGILFVFLLILSACGTGNDENNNNVNHNNNMNMNGNNDHSDSNDHDNNSEMDMDHDDDHSERIPNDGAVIHISSPVDGATFTEGDDITVEVEVEGFDLSVEGAHWHVYVDDQSYGMVMGGDLDSVLRAVEPGEHTISAYLAGPDHIELEDGTSIVITVEEIEYNN